MERKDRDLMKTNALRLKISLFTLVFTSLCLPGSRALAEQRPEVDSAMKKFFTAMLNLQPFAQSEEKFRDPANREVISQDLATLAGLKHVFPKKMAKEEPGIAAIAGIYAESMQDIADRFKAGNLDYVRHRVRTLPEFCLSCHTRVQSDRDFLDVEDRVDQFQGTPFQKAELLAATRQFDKATTALLAVLDGKPKGEMGFLEYTRALRYFLYLTVRVKADPELTVRTLDRLSKRRDLPEYDQRLVAGYLKDADFWRKHPTAGRDLSGEVLVKRAKELVERANSLQLFATDESGDISYLRATGYLHQALDHDPTAKYRGEALYLLGITYHSLEEPVLWQLDTMYLQACVRENPHTPIARDCYGKYASIIYFGYTGSAGTDIPEDELKKLGNLRQISQ